VKAVQNEPERLVERNMGFESGVKG